MILETSDVVFKKTIFSEKAYFNFFLNVLKLLLLKFKNVVIRMFHTLYNICTISKIAFICKSFICKVHFPSWTLKSPPRGENSAYKKHGVHNLLNMVEDI